MFVGCSVFNTKKAFPSIVGNSYTIRASEQKKWRRQLLKQPPANFTVCKDSFSGFTSEHFVDYTQNPETATMLYHANSGHAKFLKTMDLLQSNAQIDTINLESIKAEIEKEILTSEERENLLLKFSKYQGMYSGNIQQSASVDNNENCIMNGIPKSIDAHILGCSACGKKYINGLCGKNYITVSLSKVPDIIKLNDKEIEKFIHNQQNDKVLVPVDEMNTIKEINISALQSVYYSVTLKNYYHLHPELVHVTENIEYVCLCPTCADYLCFAASDKKQKPRKPPNSIAAGIDFGNYHRIGLTKPSPIELILLARFRHFHNIAKLNPNRIIGQRTDGTSNAIRCHSILFQHDAPIIASIAVMFHQWLQQPSRSHLHPDTVDMLQSCITVQLVNSDNCLDLIAKNMKMQTFLQARPFVIHQWLTVLHKKNPLYAHDPQISIEQYEQFQNYITMCNENIREKANEIVDSNLNNADKVIGDDINHNRTTILTDDNNDDNDTSDMNANYSLITQPHKVLQNNDDHLPETNDDTLEYILGAAKAFGVSIPLKHKTKTSNKGRPRKRAKINNPNDYVHTIHSTWESTRSTEPANEFNDFQSILSGAFPHVFPLGQAYKISGVPNPIQIEHLLMQYNNIAAHCRELLFYLFDCKLRHRVIHNLSAKIKSNTNAFQKFNELMKQKDFKDQLREAAQNYKSRNARKLVNSMTDILTFGSEETILCSLLNKKASSKAMAMIQRHGPASIMLTVTPDDISSPNNIRLAMRNINNVTFPSCADDNFFEHLRSNSTNFLPDNMSTPISLSYKDRKKLAVHNPVALAFNFRAMLQNIITVLLGSPLDYQPGVNSKKVTTWWFQSNAKNSPHSKGIFGFVNAHFGCIEVQSRGALHFHILVWGGITPSLLETAAFIPELSKAVSRALDTMFCAQMPKEYHVQDIILRFMKQTRSGRQQYPKDKSIPSSVRHIPSCINSVGDWKHHLYTALQRTGVHEHTFTCKKPPQGSRRCRGAKPSATSSQTRPIFLSYPKEIKHDRSILERTLPQEINTPLHHNLLNRAEREKRNYLETPIIDLSKDTLHAWELLRPVISDIPPVPTTISNVKNSVMNIAQQNSIKMICIEEIIKLLPHHVHESQTNADIHSWLTEQELSTIMALYDNIHSNVPQRNGKMVETNDILQVATGSSTNAILLGAAEQSRCALFYVAPYVSTKNKVAVEASLYALRAAHEHISKFPSRASDTGTQTRTTQHLFTRVINTLSRAIEVSDTQVALTLLNVPSLISSDSYVHFVPNYSINFINDQINEQPMNENQSYGPATPFTVKNMNDENDNTPLKIPVHRPLHWWNRGYELRNMTLLEYTALIDILPINSNIELDTQKSKVATGRKKRKAFLFTKSHPLHSTHAQFLRAKQKTVIFCWTTQRPKLPAEKPIKPDKNASGIVQSNYEEAMNNWQTKSNFFASFCSAVFFQHPDNYFGPSYFGAEPEEIQTVQEEVKHTYICQWSTFCREIHTLETSNRLIDHMRLKALITFLTASQSDHAKRILLSNWRHRSTTRWSHEERAEAQILFSSISLSDRCQQALEESILEYDTVKAFTEQQITFCEDQTRFRNIQIKSLQQICIHHEYIEQSQSHNTQLQLASTGHNWLGDQVGILAGGRK